MKKHLFSITLLSLVFTFILAAGDGKLGSDERTGGLKGASKTGSLEGNKKKASKTQKSTKFSGFISQASSMSVTVHSATGSTRDSNSFGITSETKVTIDGKEAKGGDLQTRMAVSVTTTEDQKTALTISATSPVDSTPSKH